MLNYLVNDIGYKNLYMERNAVGELTGKYGWNTDHYNKANMVDGAKTAIRNESVMTYDRKLIRQLRALVIMERFKPNRQPVMIGHWHFVALSLLVRNIG